VEIISKWTDYELIDAGDGEKLERWGLFILRRPDPQAIWSKDANLVREWETASATYSRSSTGGGCWNSREKLPAQWIVKYDNLKFYVRPTGFKHTGIFPEQANNWDFLRKIINENKQKLNRPIKVLNLFGYTGCATVACVDAGAEVCHVDSSKQILTTAKDNLVLSGLGDKYVRFIPEDAFGFVKKEIRRNSKYDIIIMDPPTFGRGDKGQVWKIEKDLNNFVGLCMQILTDKPLAFLINAYVSGLSAQTLKNILYSWIQRNIGGEIEANELGLPIDHLDCSRTQLVLPTGVYARWYNS
jgi:23S rRNA (cytosine1962-C5)-methyltransferase